MTDKERVEKMLRVFSDVTALIAQAYEERVDGPIGDERRMLYTQLGFAYLLRAANNNPKAATRLWHQLCREPGVTLRIAGPKLLS